MRVNFANQLCRQVAIAIDKQLHFAKLLGTGDWRLDLSSGLLHLGEYHWHVQILGTEADDSQTWLWAWANEASSIPSSLLGSALTLRMLGEANGIPELAEAEVPLGEVSGHGCGRSNPGVYAA